MAVVVLSAACANSSIVPGDAGVGDARLGSDAGTPPIDDGGLASTDSAAVPDGATGPTDGAAVLADGTSPADGSSPLGDAAPPLDDANPSGCALDLAHLSAPGCTVLKTDTAVDADVVTLWRRIDCQETARVAFVATGGDPHATASGASQGNTSYRRTTVFDGDDYYGERCELGKNDWRDSFAVYHQGERRITFVSLRLPDDFPLSTSDWQVVLQMKQAQPSDNGGGTPILSLEARGGRWHLIQSTSSGPSSDTTSIWSTAAQPNVWTRFAIDVTYSPDPAVGSVQVFVDQDNDGVADETSPRLATYTQKIETAGTSDDGLDAGDAIPSHLRVGLYHNPGIACAAGCSVEIDNVQVVAPDLP